MTEHWGNTKLQGELSPHVFALLLKARWGRRQHPHASRFSATSGSWLLNHLIIWPLTFVRKERIKKLLLSCSTEQSTQCPPSILTFCCHLRQVTDVCTVPHLRPAGRCRAVCWGREASYSIFTTYWESRSKNWSFLKSVLKYGVSLKVIEMAHKHWKHKVNIPAAWGSLFLSPAFIRAAHRSLLLSPATLPAPRAARPVLPPTPLASDPESCPVAGYSSRTVAPCFSLTTECHDPGLWPSVFELVDFLVLFIMNSTVG